jgi:uncharacterized protein
MKTDDELWQQALHCFAIRDWWMAHEVLEELWRRHPGTDDARFYQGLLQAAVCFHHYGNANFAGARQQAAGALALLAPLSDTMHGIKLGKFRVDFEATVKPLLTEGAAPKPLDPREIPEITSAREA